MQYVLISSVLNNRDISYSLSVVGLRLLTRNVFGFICVQPSDIFINILNNMYVSSLSEPPPRVLPHTSYVCQLQLLSVWFLRATVAIFETFCDIVCTLCSQSVVFELHDN